MLSYRTVLRRRAADVAVPPAVMPGLDEVHDSPLVPCNDLRARWVTAENGRLELRWELPQTPSQAQAA